MYSIWKKNKFTNKIVLLAIILIGILLCFGILRANVRFLWGQGYHTIAYFIGSEDPELINQMGNYYFGGGGYDLDKAKKSYKFVASKVPEDKFVHYQLARIYFVEGDMDLALQEINMQIEADPNNLRALYVRGLIKDRQGDLPGAERDFADFTLWAPMEWGGYNDLAFVLAKEKKYSESAEVIHRAMRTIPEAQDIPWLWNSLGLAQLNMLQFKEAEISFTKALTLVEKITPREWQRAYSGNDPVSAGRGIEVFQETIKRNILLSKNSAL